MQLVQSNLPLGTLLSDLVAAAQKAKTSRNQHTQIKKGLSFKAQLLTKLYSIKKALEILIVAAQ